MTDWQQTVFVVDDDDSFLRSIRRLLNASGYTTDCYRSASEFLTQRPVQAGGCVIADLRMPAMNGLELQTALTKSSNPLPVVFLTGHGDIPTSVRAIRCGAEDFLEKTAPREELLAAVERALSRDVREREMRSAQFISSSRIERLTPRERLILSYVMRGQLNKQIANEVGIDERSVKRHRSSIMRKLEVDSVASLVSVVFDAQKSGRI